MNPKTSPLTVLKMGVEPSPELRRDIKKLRTLIGKSILHVLDSKIEYEQIDAELTLYYLFLCALILLPVLLGPFSPGMFIPIMIFSIFPTTPITGLVGSGLVLLTLLTLIVGRICMLHLRRNALSTQDSLSSEDQKSSRENDVKFENVTAWKCLNICSLISILSSSLGLMLWHDFFFGVAFNPPVFFTIVGALCLPFVCFHIYCMYLSNQRAESIPIEKPSILPQLDSSVGSQSLEPTSPSPQPESTLKTNSNPEPEPEPEPKPKPKPDPKPGSDLSC